MTDAQPQLALDLPGLDQSGGGELVEAVRVSLRELRELGQVTTRHAAQVQLALAMAQAVERGNSSGRASAAAMAARELRETLLVLDPPPEDAGGVDQLRTLRELMGKLDEVARIGAGAQLRVVE